MKLIIDLKELEDVYNELHKEYCDDFEKAKEKEDNFVKILSVGKDTGLIAMYTAIIRNADFTTKIEGEDND